MSENYSSLTVVREQIRKAIRFPLRNLVLMREAEDFGHVVCYGLSGWVNRLEDRRWVRIKTPATWMDWIKRGLNDKFRWTRKWFSPYYVTTENDVWLLFRDLPEHLFEKYSTTAICFNAVEPFYGEEIE